jgi:hypothetical protein
VLVDAHEGEIVFIEDAEQKLSGLLEAKARTLAASTTHLAA